MWEQIIEYLKDPLLVIKVQNFFGVTYKSNESTKQNESSEVIHSERVERVIEESDIKQHKRIPSNISSSSQSSYDTDSSGDSGGKDAVECSINNKFWYYLFVLGTELGDEIFYATFIPFWFWNIDGAVGRRVVLVWTVCMYIGQGFKDIIRWPRPGYPVKKLQTKWAVEYGMPSTHAMVGVSIPFSVLLYTMDRYQYPIHWGLIIAVSWCTLICVSRIYLGMHSVLSRNSALAGSNTAAPAPARPRRPIARLDATTYRPPARLRPGAGVVSALDASSARLPLHRRADSYTPAEQQLISIQSSKEFIIKEDGTLGQPEKQQQAQILQQPDFSQQQQPGLQHSQQLQQQQHEYQQLLLQQQLLQQRQQHIEQQQKLLNEQIYYNQQQSEPQIYQQQQLGQQNYYNQPQSEQAYQQQLYEQQRAYQQQATRNEEPFQYRLLPAAAGRA